MGDSSRISAALAYIPIIGWLYVLFFQRKNALASFHLRQSIGLFLFLVAALVGWYVIFWLLAWIPYMDVVGIALFTLVIASYIFGVVVWILGFVNALKNRLTPLPLFGQLNSNAINIPVTRIAVLTIITSTGLRIQWLSRSIWLHTDRRRHAGHHRGN